MGYCVCNGALLQCSFGSSAGCFTLLPGGGTAAGQRAERQANELVATAAGGLTLKGAEVQVNAGGKLRLQGTETHLNGMATTEVAASGFLKLQGTLIQLN